MQVATPDVREEKLTPQDDVMILASDGLWDVLSNQEAVNMIREIDVSVPAYTARMGYLLARTCFWQCNPSKYILEKVMSDFRTGIRNLPPPAA
jgi:serine/threonine protein phosphatase PrpC